MKGRSSGLRVFLPPSLPARYGAVDGRSVSGRTGVVTDYSGGTAVDSHHASLPENSSGVPVTGATMPGSRDPVNERCP